MSKKFLIAVLLICELFLFGCAGEGKKEDVMVDVQSDVSEQPIELVEIQDAKPGDYVAFGFYEQDNRADNGTEAIEWLVLAKEENRVLVISKDIIACQPFHEERVYVTWEECSLRKWLNGDFVSEAFAEEERSKIMTVTVKGVGNELYKVAAGNDTNDQIFILSAEEVDEYFDTAEKMQSHATTRAIENGAYVSEENGASWWWLRSRGYDEDRVMRISGIGEISNAGERVDRTFVGVRPAMWIEY